MKNQKVRVSIQLAMIFALGLCAVLSVDAAHLRLVSLKCKETEDIKFDEALLRVGSFDLRRTMRNGDVWALNRRIFFDDDDVITVRLYDEDKGPFDHNDYLGGVIIDSEVTNGNQLVVFSRDDALYELTYRVER
jgi:hypothetical protein